MNVPYAMLEVIDRSSLVLGRRMYGFDNDVLSQSGLLFTLLPSAVAKLQNPGCL